MGDKYGSIWRSLRDGDFEEEEVWDVLKNRADYHNHHHHHHGTSGIPKSKVVPSASSSSSSSPISIPRSSSRMITSSSSHETHVGFQQSAPVNIPDWSQIYNRKKNYHNSSKKNKKSSKFDDDDDDCDDDDDDDEEFGPKLPPHEVIARRLARTQISSFSVFEGVGRTLKGRDLSKVRNAILTKTGFLESP